METEPKSTVEPAHYTAQVFRRVLAAVIDLNLFTAISLLASASILKKAKQYAAWPQSQSLSAEYLSLYIGYNVFTVILLLSITLALFKKTPGQHFCRLQLQPKPQFLDAFLYFSFLGLQLFTLGVSLLGILINPQRPSIHERISGLTLYQKRPSEPQLPVNPALEFWVRSLQSIYALFLIFLVSLYLTQKHVELSSQERVFSLFKKDDMTQNCQKKISELSDYHPLDAALALHLSGQTDCVEGQLTIGFHSKLPQDRIWSLFVSAFVNRFDKSMHEQYVQSLCLNASEPELEPLKQRLCEILSKPSQNKSASPVPIQKSKGHARVSHLFERVSELLEIEKSLGSYDPKPRPVLGKNTLEEGRFPASAAETNPYGEFIKLARELSLPPAFDGFVKEVTLRVFSQALSHEQLADLSP